MGLPARFPTSGRSGPRRGQPEWFDLLGAGFRRDKTSKACRRWSPLSGAVSRWTQLCAVGVSEPNWVVALSSQASWMRTDAPMVAKERWRLWWAMGRSDAHAGARESRGLPEGSAPSRGDPVRPRLLPAEPDGRARPRSTARQRPIAGRYRAEHRSGVNLGEAVQSRTRQGQAPLPVRGPGWPREEVSVPQARKWSIVGRWPLDLYPFEVRCTAFRDGRTSRCRYI